MSENLYPRAAALLEYIAGGNDLNGFVLVGGMAITLYELHRQPQDLYFFVNEEELSTQSLSKIEALISKLKNAYEIKFVKGDKARVFYKFDGVSVKFIAYPIEILSDARKYKNINVASIKKLAYVKLDAILRHRRKARDFYDLKYLMLKFNLKLEDILDVCRYHVKLMGIAENAMAHLLLKHRLIDKEGIIEAKFDTDIKTIREFLKNEVKRLSEERAEIFNFSTSEIKTNINKKYGLSRNSLLMELYLIKMEQKLYKIDLLEAKADLDYENFNKCDIFYYALSNTKFLDYLLLYTSSTPKGLKNKAQRFNGALELVKRHELINDCLNKSEDEIKEFIKRKSIQNSRFIKLVKKKREILSGGTYR